MSYSTIMRQQGSEPPQPAALSWPTPDNEIVAAIRTALGRRLPPGTPQRRELGQPAPQPVDRLDLIMRACHMQTAAVAILWLNGQRRQGRGTRIAYADDLIHWGDWLERNRRPRLDLTALTRDDIALWLTHQRSLDRAPATIARRLAALSSLYRYAAGYGLPVWCPIHDDDHRPKVKGGRRATSARVLSDEQVAAMFLRAADVRDAAIMGLLFTDGLRVSELCSATVNNYDPAQRTLTVVRKGDDPSDPTRVQVAPAVGELLDRWLAERPTWEGQEPAPLLTDSWGGRLTRDGVARTLARVARAAGVPHAKSVTPHSLRASAITDQIRRGKSLVEVQAFAGHASPTTTMGYFHDVEADTRNAAMAADLSRLVALPPWLATPAPGENPEDEADAAS